MIRCAVSSYNKAWILLQSLFATVASRFLLHSWKTQGSALFISDSSFMVFHVSCMDLHCAVTQCWLWQQSLIQTHLPWRHCWQDETFVASKHAWPENQPYHHNIEAANLSTGLRPCSQLLGRNETLKAARRAWTAVPQGTVSWRVLFCWSEVILANMECGA